MFKRANKIKKNNNTIPAIDINDAINISEKLSKIEKGATISEEDLKLFQQSAQLIELLVSLHGVWSKSKKRITNLLKIVFGNRSEKLKDLKRDFLPIDQKDSNKIDGIEENLVVGENNGESNPGCGKNPKPDENKKRRNGGGGKNSADDYTKAVEIECKLDHDKLPGKICPVCNKSKLFEIDQKKIVRLMGNAPIYAYKFIQQQTRCICGAIFTAEVGNEFKEIYNGEKYSPSALAAIIIIKYLMGTSFGKLEKIQKMSGTPLPATTQINKIKIMALPMIKSIVAVLRTLAANAHTLAYDDTRIKTLEKRKNKNGEDTHIGHGTAVIAGGFDDQDNKIVIFDFDVNKHAGIVVCDMLAERKRASLPLLISDGLQAYDESKKHGIDINCNIHARRKVVEEDPKRKTYIGYTVLECYKAIYVNDSFCKNNGLNDIERMQYHKENSFDHFKKIKIIFQIIIGKDISTIIRQNLKIPDFLGEEEPNSDLYKMAKYFLDRLLPLTRVMEIPSVPLDTNDVERVIKCIILLRKNSLFFHNHFSAYYSGEILTLLETAHQAEVNVFEYMDYLLSNKEKVIKDSKNYLPWLFNKRDEEKDQYWKNLDQLMRSPSNFSEFSTAENSHSSA
jgi:hypothetical protein